ncbi:hypothetical protein BpHYR1_052153 [Brachionus plicatilis]|uniref:Uncharacterized protein n=1 Tax=Brachionus plicatilis TaxID=10195 RepID=A0A3M7R4E6_BRAPC|nr:hypothetical protein BpHYR1_052153 [Brachionus plicatilis]
MNLQMLEIPSRHMHTQSNQILRLVSLEIIISELIKLCFIISLRKNFFEYIFMKRFSIKI